MSLMHPLKMGGSVPKPFSSRALVQNSSGTNQSRILIADDVPGILEIIVAILNQAGYVATGVNDGAMAWDALCAEKFDLLITDHDMPRLTGVDLLRRIRAGSCDLPRILMSGRVPYEELDLVELVQPGMIMLKPFSFTELLGNVRHLLSQNENSDVQSQYRQPSNGLEFDLSPATNESWRQEVMGSPTEIRRIIGVS